jgi:signal transduction histidine kinase/HD-like signal output (HDOD) protein
MHTERSSSTAQTPAPSGQDAARARQIEMVLEGIESLPTLSPIATRVIQLSSSTETNAEEISKVIESDPSLATRIVGLCRRADKGLGDKITTVKRAVVMLGHESVRSAALSVSVFDLLNRESSAARQLDESLSEQNGVKATTSRGFDRKGYWTHCVAVACASELIASAQPKLKVLPEEAFLAGLLHGIGRIALDFVLPKAYARVIELAERRGCSTALVERQLIGLDHHTAGRRLAAHWQLPGVIQDVIWLHDQPIGLSASVSAGGAGATSHVAVVTAARALCRHMHLGWSGDFGPHPNVVQAWRDQGILTDPALLGTKLPEQVAERMRVLGLDEATTPQLLLESLASATKQLSRLNSALHERAKLSGSQTRTLEAIAAFNARSVRATSLTDTLTTIGGSATQVLGEGYIAVLLRSARGEAWQLFEFDSGGKAQNVRSLEPPTGVVGELSLGSFGAEGQLTLTTMGLLPWLSEFLAGAPDLRTLKLVPLAQIGTSNAGASEGQPVAILVTDRTLPFDAGERGALRTLVGCWGAAISAITQREKSQRLSDELVESARALTQAKSKLAERESLAKLGETTAGAAHEMNNPLTVIAGRAQLLLTRLKDERDKSAAQAITSAARQIGELIQSLHLLSNHPQPTMRVCETREVVQRALAGARGRVCADCNPSVDLEALPTTIMTDPDLLSNALGELIANALEASPDGPIAIIGDLDERDNRLHISVLDSGPGLSERAMRHAFDPFFSEKAAGRGRGMGLTRARIMAEALSGEVLLRSGEESSSSDATPKQGTTATLCIRDWRKVDAPSEAAAGARSR